MGPIRSRPAGTRSLVPAKRKKPRRRGPGRSLRGVQTRSVTAVHQPPARTPGGREQAAHIAVAIAEVISGAADDDAGAAPAPAMVPATMMVPTAACRGR